MGYSSENERQNKVLGDLIKGKTPEKRVMVGYKSGKEPEKHGDIISPLSIPESIHITVFPIKLNWPKARHQLVQFGLPFINGEIPVCKLITFPVFEMASIKVCFKRLVPEIITKSGFKRAIILKILLALTLSCSEISIFGKFGNFSS